MLPDEITHARPACLLGLGGPDPVRQEQIGSVNSLPTF